VDIKGQHWLRTVTGGRVALTLPEVLPDRFTVEVDYWSPSFGNPLEFNTNTSDPAMESAATFGLYPNSAHVNGPTVNSQQSIEALDKNTPVHGRFTIDTRYVKAYINEKRLANAPNAPIARTNSIIISLPSGTDEEATIFTNLRIATGGKKLYDALAAKGHVATHGILFDTGSDRIRPESTPTLKEIGEMLKAHADLKLTIEDHTDNIGSAESNQVLSEKRAAAVKTYLVSTYSIDVSRLEAKGFGTTKPAATNDTAEGRQNNRRVELVKR
jgi:outer membrane protein OmpA-like peptidoglycan-associated protein